MAQRPIQMETAPFSDPRTSPVPDITPDLDPGYPELIQAHPGNGSNRLLHDAVSCRAIGKPVAKFNSRNRPIDRLQTNSTKQVPSVTGDHQRQHVLVNLPTMQGLHNELPCIRLVEVTRLRPRQELLQCHSRPIDRVEERLDIPNSVWSDHQSGGLEAFREAGSTVSQGGRLPRVEASPHPVVP